MVSVSGSSSVRGLGGQVECQDVCDPYCVRYTDTPSGITPPSGLVTKDGSVITNAEDTNSITACTGITISGATDLTVTQISPSVSPNTLTFNVALSPVGCYVGALPNALWSIESTKIDRAVITGSAQTGTLTVVNPVVGPILITARLAGFTATTTANIKVNIGPDARRFGRRRRHQHSLPLRKHGDSAFADPADRAVDPGHVPRDRHRLRGRAALPFGQHAATATFEWRGTQLTELAAIPITIAIPPANVVVNLATGRRFPSIPTTVWKIFEQSAKGANADLIVRRKSALGWHAEKLRTIRFAQGQLKGTVYYQSYGTQLARNFAGGALPNVAADPTFPAGVFGAATLAIRPGATSPTVIAGTPTSASDTSGSACRVCHTASANGSVLVTQKFGGGNLVSIVASNLSATTPTLNKLTSYSDGRTSWPGSTRTARSSSPTPESSPRTTPVRRPAGSTAPTTTPF